MMENVVHFKPHTALVSNTSLVQRSTYFVLGFGLIVTAMVDPPITSTWMAVANVVGVFLVFAAILGKRLVPELEGSRLLREPRVVTSSIGLLLGLGLSILAIATPPVATAWAAYIHIVAIALVTQAIISYDFLLTKTRGIETGNTSTKTYGSRTKSVFVDYPKAA